MSRIAVFSDVHLTTSHPARTRAFVKTLRELASESLTDLWLLGDIFDLLVGGYGFWHDQYPEVWQALDALRARGTRIVWLEGNHDFHLDALCRRHGIEVRDEVLQLTVGRAQHRVYLAHGDLVNLTDEAYLRWRGFTRAPWFRQVLDLTPDFIARRLLQPAAEAASRSSRKRSRDPEAWIQNFYREFAAARLREGFRGVFLGHCHVADLYRPESGGFYLNLGSWLGDTGPYAVWDPDTEDFPKVRNCKIIEE